ncbi:MAG TPA: DinB family protein [Ktedonobacterales bacterium]|jgi:uncharacterized damage-inducible protein DinB
MSEQQQAIAPFYNGWDVYQGLLVKAIAPLTPEQLALRSAPNLRSIAELAGHIIAGRIIWFHMVMGEGSPDLLEQRERFGRHAEERTAQEFVEGLEITWQLMQACLVRWTPADLEYVFRGEWRGEPYALSRQWVIWHLIEHDLHHGGELSLTLGIHGLAAPDL